MTHMISLLRYLMRDERGSIFGEYGFLFVAVAIAALAGLVILGGNLSNYFGTTIASYFQ